MPLISDILLLLSEIYLILLFPLNTFMSVILLLSRLKYSRYFKAANDGIFSTLLLSKYICVRYFLLFNALISLILLSVAEKNVSCNGANALISLMLLLHIVMVSRLFILPSSVISDILLLSRYNECVPLRHEIPLRLLILQSLKLTVYTSFVSSAVSMPSLLLSHSFNNALYRLPSGIPFSSFVII